MTDIHAIILTLNEEIHIERCISSIRDEVSTITIVDSGSVDNTVNIAIANGAHVVKNPWKNYASQLNYGISSLKDKDGWILRIDADEVLVMDHASRSLKETIKETNIGVNGVLIARRIFFLGQRIRFGGIEPSWQLRLWRNGHGRCEQRWMDEHIVVDGEVTSSSLVINDINLNSIDWWTSKHNSYASREAIDMINIQRELEDKHELVLGTGAGFQAGMRRFIKEKIYIHLPGGLRAFAYFIYRYFIRLGFIDGKAGLYFHFLQCFWYRLLVDAKIYEIQLYAKNNNICLIESIKDRTGFDLLK